jgi:hypothetical protein
MSRLIPHNDMTAVQLADCCRQAWAIMRLCELAAWSLQQQDEPDPNIADSIGQAQKLAMSLIEPVQDALESHEGLRGDTTEGGAA